MWSVAKVGGLKKKFAYRSRPQSNKSARVWGGPRSNHSQSLMADNFAALWIADSKFLVCTSEDCNLSGWDFPSILQLTMGILVGTQCCIYNIDIKGTRISILRSAIFHVELGQNNNKYEFSVPFLINRLNFSVLLDYIFIKTQKGLCETNLLCQIIHVPILRPGSMWNTWF